MKSRIAGLGLLLTCLAGCSSQSPALSTVPSGLKDIESVAEDAYDKALAGDHAAVSADADSIDTAWNTFKTQAMTDGATAGLVASVDAAVSALKTVVTSTAGDLALARSANGVSAPMSGLFALYEDPVPPAVLELDYLGREVVLDARELRFGDAST
ncbi:MAG: hypothetical protein KC933_22955, partial [Myxococcales bacterium]|nr:hypothetical protein [Myxococcales bacterium]